MRFTVGYITLYRRLNGNNVAFQINTRHVSNLQNMNDDEWIEQLITEGHHMLTALADRHPPSHSRSTVRG